MATQAVESCEAVIISGPRKGEFLTIAPNGSSDAELPDPRVEAMLEKATKDARRVAETAQAVTAEAAALLQEMREARRELHESFGSSE